MEIRAPLFAVVVAGWGVVVATTGAEGAAWVISGNETKLDLASGAIRRVEPTGPDSLTLMDFATFPPRVIQVPGVPNSVVGPPSNVAITPDGGVALVASSIRFDSVTATNWIPDTEVAVVELGVSSARKVGAVRVGLQPSGISIRGDGKAALVANRAAGTLSVLSIEGTRVEVVGEVTVAGAADGVADVAISPDGRTVLASVQKGGYLAVLRWTGALPEPTGQKVSTCGQPYRVVITPDGELGLTAGSGAGNRVDRDALTVVDLKSRPIRTVDYVALGAVPESFEVSPDGRWVAAVVMDGSNLAPGDPNRREAGRLILLERAGRTYRVRQELAVGRIPEGVAFTADGRYVVVQAHADRQVEVYALRRGRLRDTGYRVGTPGYPSSLRAAPRPR